MGDNGGNLKLVAYLVTCRGNLLMEMGLLHNYVQIFLMHGEKYYFCMEGSMQSEIEPTQGEIEMNTEINMTAGGCGESFQIWAGTRLGAGEWGHIGVGQRGARARLGAKRVRLDESRDQIRRLGLGWSCRLRVGSDGMWADARLDGQWVGIDSSSS